MKYMLEMMYIWARNNRIRAALSVLAIAILAATAWVLWFIHSFQRANLISKAGIYDMAWSPDGNSLAVSERGFEEKGATIPDSLRILSWNNGALQINQSIPLNSATGQLSWSPDGDWIGSLQRPNVLHTFQLSSGRIFQPFGQEQAAVSFAWSLPPTSTNDPAGPEVVGMEKDESPKTEMFLRARRAGESESSPSRFHIQLQEAQIQAGTFSSCNIIRILPEGIVRHLSASTEHNSSLRSKVSVQDIRAEAPGGFQAAGSEITQIFRCDAPCPAELELSLSQDGTTMALMNCTFGVSAQFDLWNLKEGKIVQTLAVPRQLEPGIDIRPAWNPFHKFGNSAWSSDDKHFAAAILLWDSQKQPNGCLLAWWDVASGKLLAAKQVWMFNQNFLMVRAEQRALPIAMWRGCWSPSLDRVALWRRIQISAPGFPEYNCQRSIVSVVPAPPEAIP
ncbi:MAG: hypothetical protein ACAI35_04015 [Candidatus Methylacidiphilales bacterium]|nr:hypothetical protein [Candidatus Methylacidiphilales bacterium]